MRGDLGHHRPMDSHMIKLVQTDPARITPAQVRAARGLLAWSQTQAAEACGVGKATLQRFEAGDVGTSEESIELMVRGFGHSGVIFATAENGRGVLFMERPPAR